MDYSFFQPFQKFELFDKYTNEMWWHESGHHNMTNVCKISTEVLSLALKEYFTHKEHYSLKYYVCSSNESSLSYVRISKHFNNGSV